MKRLLILAVVSLFVWGPVLGVEAESGYLGKYNSEPSFPSGLTTALNGLGTQPKDFAVLRFNNDDLYDIFVGAIGVIYYFENTGTATTPEFSSSLVSAVSLFDVDPEFTSNFPLRIATTDINDDGYSDLIVSQFDTFAMRIFLHNGSTTPGFTEITDQSPFPEFTQTKVTPDFAYVNDDDIEDALFGVEPDQVLYLIASQPSSPGDLRTYTEDQSGKFNAINSEIAGASALKNNIAPSLIDINGDQYKDLVIGSASKLYYFLGVDGGGFNSFTGETEQNTLDRLAKSNSTLAFGDITGDQRAEIFIGQSATYSDDYLVYENMPTLSDIMKGLRVLAGDSSISITTEEVAVIDIGTTPQDGIVSLDDIVASIIQVATAE